MGDVVKGIAIGVIIAVAIVVTQGAIIGFAPGVTLGSAVASAAIVGGIAGGLGAIAQRLLVEDPPDFEGLEGRRFLSIDIDALGAWVFGETIVPGNVIYAVIHGLEAETAFNDRYVSHVVAVAAHEIDSYGDFYIEELLVPFPNAGYLV